MVYGEATYFPFLYFSLAKSSKYQIRSGETFLLVVVVILISYRTKRTCIRETFSCLYSRAVESCFLGFFGGFLFFGFFFFIKYLLISKS